MTISSVVFCRPLDHRVAPRPDRPSNRCSIGCCGSSDEYRIVARAARSISFDGRGTLVGEPGSDNSLLRTRSESVVFMLAPWSSRDSSDRYTTGKISVRGTLEGNHQTFKFPTAQA